MSDSGVSDEVRGTLALALDVDDLVAATRLGRELMPWFGVAKIGLELYSAAGPDAVGALRELGYDVFLDLKLHDIPNTVGKAARVLGALGVDYLTLHAFGGVDMLRAGVEGLAEGAANAGLEPPVALGVTVLTSDGGAHDQANVATPGEAMAQGADVLVIGRAVTAAPDPAEAANAIVADLLS